MLVSVSKETFLTIVMVGSRLPDVSAQPFWKAISVLSPNMGQRISILSNLPT